MKIHGTLGVIALLAAGVLTAGCNQEDSPTGPAAVAPAKTAAQETSFRLSEEPPGAKGVIDVRKTAKEDEEVVIVGHIAGSEHPIVKDRVAFTIVDLSLEPCEDERPWIYCCCPREELKAAMVMVKFVDDDGKTVAGDARQVLGVKEWSAVVVRGHAQRDADGNLTAIIAHRLFVRP